MKRTLISCLLALLGASAAHALPALQSLADYGFDNRPQLTSQLVYGTGSDIWLANNASFSASAQLGAPAVSGFVGTAGWRATHQANADAQAGGFVQYDFLVQTASVFSEVVPVTVHGRYYVTQEGVGEASGYLKVSRSATAGGLPSGVGVLGRTSVTFGCSGTQPECGVLQEFSFDINLASFSAVEAGDIGRLQLSALARLGSNAEYTASAFAWVDPMFEINPTWAAAHPGASLVLGPGASNSFAPLPAVPEPASLGLMSLGVVALLWHRRRAKA